jgi:hypothetical protein
VAHPSIQNWTKKNQNMLGLAQQNGVGPSKRKLNEGNSKKKCLFGSSKWFWLRIFSHDGLRLVKGTTQPNTCF